MSITILAKYKQKTLLAEIFNKSSKTNRSRKEIKSYQKKQNFSAAAKDIVNKITNIARIINIPIKKKSKER